MIDTVVKISCDWCGTIEMASKNMCAYNGKKIRVGEKSFRKTCEKRGWITVVFDHMVRDFCGQDCYDSYKMEESKP